jgi:hypothetical protein
MLPCLLVTGWFGMWIESQIFLEWSMPIAYLASVEILNLCDSQDIARSESAVAVREQDVVGGGI